MVVLDNLTVSYRQHPALHHVSGRFGKGTLTAVVGPNGSGKSTLLKSIVSLLPYQARQMTVSIPLSRIAYLPQIAEIDESFPINVWDCVLLGLWREIGARGAVRRLADAQIEVALQTVGLQGFERRPICSLSSGQFQRVLFARLLVQDADLILLDEPFRAMDGKTTASLLALVHMWHQQARTVIVVSHDIDQVREHFPQTLLLARERVAWGDTAEVLTETNLHRARAMAEAWDEDADLCQIDASLPAARVVSKAAVPL